MAEYRIDSSLIAEVSPTLRCGDRVLLSGTVYTARDAAHKRIAAMIENGEKLPFELEGACVYYAGPTPAPPGLPIGSCGPTTSSRMDPYAPLLLDKGLACMIGKGPRNADVVDAIARNNAVYLCAIGGAGALLAKCIKSAELIAFEDLGAEALRKLYVEDMPLVVIIDSEGNNLYEDGRAAYLKERK